MSEINAGGIGYSGEVRIAVKRGKTTLSERTVHNSGRVRLFKFLANALAGDYNKSLSPRMVRLFGKDKAATNDSTDVSTNKNADDPADENTWQFTEELAVSPWVTVGSAGVVEVTSKDGEELNDQAKVGFSFRIPASLITGEFCKIALYDMNPSAAGKDKLAVVGLIENKAWAPEEIEDKNGQSLEIEWTMTIQNTTTNATK
jgi:hypothetical protein